MAAACHARRMRMLSIWAVCWVGCGAAVARSSEDLSPSHVDGCAGHTTAVDLGMVCERVEGGVFRVEVEALATVPCEDCWDEGEQATEGTYRIVWVAEDGTRAASDARAFHLESSTRVTLVPLATFDWDGDGVPELALRTSFSGHESGDAVTEILTVAGASLSGFVPAEPFAAAIDEVRDVDGDGRLDVISFTPWCTGGFGTSEEGGGWTAGPRTLWHGEAGGAFDDRGAASRAFLAAECGDHTNPLLPDGAGDPELFEGAPEEALLRVTCAALSGEVADVRARLEAAWQATPCGAAEADPICTQRRDELFGRLDEVARR